MSAQQNDIDSSPALQSLKKPLLMSDSNKSLDDAAYVKIEHSDSFDEKSDELFSKKLSDENIIGTDNQQDPDEYPSPTSEINRLTILEKLASYPSPTSYVRNEDVYDGSDKNSIKSGFPQSTEDGELNSTISTPMMVEDLDGKKSMDSKGNFDTDKSCHKSCGSEEIFSVENLLTNSFAANLSTTSHEASQNSSNVFQSANLAAVAAFPEPLDPISPVTTEKSFTPYDEAGRKSAEWATNQLAKNSKCGMMLDQHLPWRTRHFNVIFAGSSGTGKTTACKKLFEGWFTKLSDSDCDLSTVYAESSLKRTTSKGSEKSMISSDNSCDNVGTCKKDLERVFTTSTKCTNTSSTNLDNLKSKISAPPAQTTQIEKRGEFQLDIDWCRHHIVAEVYDTPGYGDVLETKNSINRVVDFVEAKMNETYNKHHEIGLDRDTAKDPKMHCIIYFIQPHRLHEVDLVFMKGLADKVPLIPVIAKADSINDEELKRQRTEIQEKLTKHGIVPFELDEDDDFEFPKQRNRGKGECLALVARDGQHPWGQALSEDPSHSDFPYFREHLLYKHAFSLMDAADAKYKSYFVNKKNIEAQRQLEIKSAHQKRTTTLKNIAMVAIASASVLGAGLYFQRDRTLTVNSELETTRKELENQQNQKEALQYQVRKDKQEWKRIKKERKAQAKAKAREEAQKREEMESLRKQRDTYREQADRNKNQGCSVM